MSRKVLLEMLWWVITILVVVLVMFPIWKGVGGKFIFQQSNIFTIVIFVTFTRMIFVLRHSLMAKSVIMKLVFMGVCIPIFLYLINRLSVFQRYVDDYGFTKLVPTADSSDAIQLAQYIKYEYTFFVVAAIITSVIIPVRMLVSIWRVRNRGTV